MGSRFTPRLTRACARSRLFVRNVFVRIVTGRGISLASKNSMACRTGPSNKHARNIQQESYLGNREEQKELLGKKIVLAVIACDVRYQLFGIFGAGPM